jgi:hypothetical protein
MSVIAAKHFTNTGLVVIFHRFIYSPVKGVARFDPYLE